MLDLVLTSLEMYEVCHSSQFCYAVLFWLIWNAVAVATCLPASWLMPGQVMYCLVKSNTAGLILAYAPSCITTARQQHDTASTPCHAMQDVQLPAGILQHSGCDFSSKQGTRSLP